MSGGITIENIVHQTDAMAWLGGPVRSVYGLAGTFHTTDWPGGGLPDRLRHRPEVIELELDDNGFGVRDLASTNGVRVNGKPVLAAPLSHGDRIQLGECELQYVVEERAVEGRTWSVEETA